MKKSINTLYFQSEKKGFFCFEEIDHLLQNDKVLLETLAASGIGEMDRISHLPEFIVHHILSFCNTPAELVRMSVLSKTWFNLTASFPNLHFILNNFRHRKRFFKYFEYTTSRFYHQNLIANRLFLVATIREHAESDIVDRCLEKVLKNGVRELVIYITNSKYRLRNRLLSVSTLKTLVIHGCELPSSLMLDAVRFKSLIKLSLVSVPIDDEVIKHLTTSCPLLQEFEIDSCSGLKRVCVYGHQNLQSVYIQYNTAVERIDIEAPNLSSLRMINEDGIGAPRMNLASCKKLTTVSYFGYLLPNSNGFTNFVSNFPFVENLYLAISYKCKNLNLSSHSLRTFMLHSMCVFEEIEFNTPNLALFGYPCNYSSFWPMVRRSTHLKACMQCYPDEVIDALWFLKLRLFLDKENGFKVLNLYIHAKHSQARFFDQSFMHNFTELEKLKAIELPPYELEHVELKLDANEESSAHIAFVEAVLWCCRPQSLTLRSPVPFEEQSDVVKFTYKKLLEQDEQGHTKIQIVSPSSSEAQKQLMDLKSLSMASPREGKAISFIKEEGKLF